MSFTDPTFDLVNSLSPNEKRFFRLQSGNEKNYLYVFDALDSMEQFDPEFLKKKLKKRSLNISYEKNYLSKQILKVLRNINSLDSPLLKSNNLIADVEILYSKKLFSQALQKIEEAKQLTWRYDYFGMYMELLSIQKRILIVAPDKEIEKTFDKIEKEQSDGLKMINNLFEYVSMNSKLHAMAFSRGGLLGKKDILEFDKRVKANKLDDQDKAFSPTAKMLFHAIRMGKAFFSGDEKNALKCNNDCILSIEQNQSLFEKNPQNYVALVANSCIIMLNSGKYTEAREVLNKLRTIDQTFDFKLTQAIHAGIFDTCMKLEIAIATESCTIENISTLTREITKGLEYYKKGMSEYDRIVVTYYLAIINYFDKKVGMAQKILNEIVNANAKELAGDYYLYSKLLLGLIHLEKENFELAKRLVKNFKQDSNEFVSMIVGFINDKNLESTSAGKKKQIYEALKSTADNWFKKNKPLVFFPLQKWINNKLE